MEWYLKCLRQYADFKGRARRKELWMYILFNALFSFVAVFIDGIIGTSNESGLGLFSGLYTLAVIIPSFAVCVRRLHDIGKSGWWYFIGLIPLLGIILFIWFCKEGEPGENQWGKNPKDE